MATKKGSLHIYVLWSIYNIVSVSTYHISHLHTYWREFWPSPIHQHVDDKIQNITFYDISAKQ